MSGLVVVGDSFLDVDIEGVAGRLSPDGPVPVVDESARWNRPGGAGLTALLAARAGHEVTLLTALGDDEAGSEVRCLLTAAGVGVVAARSAATVEKVRVRAGGQTVVRLDRSVALCDGRVDPAAVLDALAGLHRGSVGAVVASAYGLGLLDDPAVRAALSRLASVVPMVWDPHPLGGLPVAGVRLATPNEAEAGHPMDLAAAVDRARELRTRWSAAAVAITRGAAGAVAVESPGVPLVVQPPVTASGDTCGAGDVFALSAAAAFSAGAVTSEAVTIAVDAASRFIAGGGVAGLPRGGEPSGPPPDPTVGPTGTDTVGAVPLARRVRAAGGRVVVAGGCFDLLHAGHVTMLADARRLGDCLIVAMNSDRSVRGLKGVNRPVVPQADRRRVLEALGCVDAVEVFDEPEPLAVLARLRPHLFVKGGDYLGREIPEQRVLDEWGGRVVALPYLAGRSTTRLLEEVHARD